ncbi:MAG: hypothetical protein SWH68_15610 [Thermodesulfobacteriota bacterium]|nr:hypothetical protein [Thermodesulfobacteriota bacterium]
MHKTRINFKGQDERYFTPGMGIRIAAALMVSVFGLFAITGSGGSDGAGTTASSGFSSAVSALVVPDRVELTKVDDSSSAASAIARSAGYSRAVGASDVVRAFDDASTDYSDQETQTWVEDTDALDMVNDVLGAMNQSAYTEFVNEGPYKALVEPIGKSDSGQSGATSTSTTTESLQEMIIDVTRDSNDDPMIIKIWLTENEGPGNMPMLVRGYFEVTEGVSDAYPYGVMEAHFRGDMLDENGEPSQNIMEMAMSIGANDDGNVTIEVVEDIEEANSGFEEVTKVRVVANAKVTEGDAYTYMYEKMPSGGGSYDESTETGTFAFDEDYFKYTTDGGTTETVLDKDNYQYRVYRYKLFDQSDGSKVTRTSGFPIQLAGGSNEGEHAYIGYYGLWAPYGLTIEDGDTVTRMDSDSDAEYTVVKVNGKLRKHTANTITLSDLDGVEMSYWDVDTDYVIAWDSTSETFKKIGERDNASGNITYYTEGNQSAVDPMEDYDGAWCEAMNSFMPLGSLFNDENGQDTTPTNESVFEYHQEQTINPATVNNMSLYYWGYTMDAPIDQSDIDGAAAGEANYWGSLGRDEASVFFFDANELVLKEDDISGDAYLLPAGLDLSNSMYQWGVNISPLTETEYAVQNAWQAHGADTYYSWETGEEDWNQFATLQDDAGDYVVFEAPLVFEYTHQTANDINGDATYDGKKFRMEYDGNHLNIPWKFNPNATGPGDGWEPMFNLKNGTVLTDSSGTQYVVKGIERAMIMQPVGDVSQASSLVIDTTIQAPTLTYDATKTAEVGDEPTGVTVQVNKGEVL